MDGERDFTKLIQKNYASRYHRQERFPATSFKTAADLLGRKLARALTVTCAILKLINNDRTRCRLRTFQTTQADGPAIMFLKTRSDLVTTAIVVGNFFSVGVAAQCNPGPGQAALFVDDQYRGRCVVLQTGDFPTAEAIGLPNDSITSIRLGKNTQVFACQDAHFGGVCERISQNVTGLGNHSVGNDTITSLRVQALGGSTVCAPGPVQAAFFVDANFTGGCVIRNFGGYPTSELLGLPNDSISSLKVGPNAQVIACRDAAFGGSCQRFTTDVANLGTEAIGNDAITSAKIERRSKKFDFDVAWTEAPGGLPLNPQWEWQSHPENAGAVPDTALCHHFAKSAEVGGLRVNIPDFADCTSQTNMDRVDLPEGWNKFICSQGESNSFHGHLNWFPVTFTGKSSWGDHSLDDDYTFLFRRDGDPLSVNRSGIHVEFDSEETVDNFHTEEWKAFHQAVNERQHAVNQLAQCGNLCDEATRALLRSAIDRPKMLFDGDTILTGMFGLDCEHDCKSELHPLYALATRRDNFENDPADEVWLMFVRNVGNEGYCSSHLWGAQFTTYTFRLPWRDGMASFEVLGGAKQSQFEGTDGTAGPSITYVRPPSSSRGVYVTFTLPPASRTPLIDGALHLRWTASSVGNGRSLQHRTIRHSNLPRAFDRTPGSVANRVNDENDEAEEKVRSAIDQLPVAQRTEISIARKKTSSERPALHPLPLSGVAREITAFGANPRMPVRPGVKAGFASRKQERDVAQMRALCAATNNRPAGLPVGACAIPELRIR